MFGNSRRSGEKTLIRKGRETDVRRVLQRGDTIRGLEIVAREPEESRRESLTHEVGLSGIHFLGRNVRQAGARYAERPR